MSDVKTPEFELEIQRETTATDVPDDVAFNLWVGEALTVAGRIEPAELIIRVVDEEEAQELNAQFAGKTYVPNVLSFPFECPPECDLVFPLLGDIIICAPVVRREAQEQEKALIAHWAHMVVHGILHLLGFIHETPENAHVMESLETQIIIRLGYPAPYDQEQEEVS